MAVLISAQSHESTAPCRSMGKLCSQMCTRQFLHCSLAILHSIFRSRLGDQLTFAQIHKPYSPALFHHCGMVQKFAFAKPGDPQGAQL